MKKIKTILMGAAAAAAGILSAPSSQHVAETVIESGTQVKAVTQQMQQRTSSQQQAQQQSSQRVTRNAAMNSYVPMGRGRRTFIGYSLSPKEYGLYLLRSGKYKYNKRCRKHWAKMTS